MYVIGYCYSLLSLTQSTVVDFIRDDCSQSINYSEDEIIRAVGILSTNGVSQGMVGGHGLYPTFSFISHWFVC